MLILMMMTMVNVTMLTIKMMMIVINVGMLIMMGLTKPTAMQQWKTADERLFAVLGGKLPKYMFNTRTDQSSLIMIMMLMMNGNLFKKVNLPSLCHVVFFCSPPYFSDIL